MSISKVSLITMLPLMKGAKHFIDAKQRPLTEKQRAVNYITSGMFAGIAQGTAVWGYHLAKPSLKKVSRISMQGKYLAIGATLGGFWYLSAKKSAC